MKNFREHAFLPKNIKPTRLFRTTLLFEPLEYELFDQIEQISSFVCLFVIPYPSIVPKLFRKIPNYFRRDQIVLEEGKNEKFNGENQFWFCHKLFAETNFYLTLQIYF